MPILQSFKISSGLRTALALISPFCVPLPAPCLLRVSRGFFGQPAGPEREYSPPLDMSEGSGRRHLAIASGSAPAPSKLRLVFGFCCQEYPVPLLEETPVRPSG